MSDMKCPVCNKPMKEQIDGTCISYQETNCICNIAAPKLIWKEMAVLRDKKNIFTQSLRMEKEFAEEECKRLQTELERTRKMLKIAIGAIETIKYSKKSDAINLRHKANKALIEIYKIKDQTTLEQKDLGNSKIKKLRYIEQIEYDKLLSQNKVEPDCLYIIE